MKQTTNYILLFSLLVYLKFNNNNTIKIGVSLLITYIVYQLFKRNNIENFSAPSCSPSAPGDSIPPKILNGCEGVIGSADSNARCYTDTPGTAYCNCVTRQGWQKVSGTKSGYNNYRTKKRPQRDYIASPEEKGKCFCDPYLVSSPNCIHSTDKSKCRDWHKIPGCPPNKVPKPGTENDSMGEDPDNTCCYSPPSCPASCPENSYCDNSTAPNCVCSPGYIGSPPECSPSPVNPPISGTCSSPDQTGYGKHFWTGTEGISSPNIPLNVGESKDFNCKGRSGFWNTMFWKAAPLKVTYQCNSPGSPPVYMKGEKKSNDETPCDQFDWILVSLKILTILIFICALYLMGAFPGQKWIWEGEEEKKGRRAEGSGFFEPGTGQEISFSDLGPASVGGGALKDAVQLSGLRGSKPGDRDWSTYGAGGQPTPQGGNRARGSRGSSDSRGFTVPGSG